MVENEGSGEVGPVHPGAADGMLGLDVESGQLQRFRTVTGSFAAYEHEVTIQTLGIEFSAMLFFHCRYLQALILRRAGPGGTRADQGRRPGGLPP